MLVYAIPSHRAQAVRSIIAWPVGSPAASPVVSDDLTILGSLTKGSAQATIGWGGRAALLELTLPMLQTGWNFSSTK